MSSLEQEKYEDPGSHDSHGDTESHGDPESHGDTDAGWRQLEEFVDRLHSAARSQTDLADFYRQLLAGCVSTLAAEGGVVWVRQGRDAWTVLHQTNLASVLDPGDAEAQTDHGRLLAQMAIADEPRVVQPQSGSLQASENPTDAVLLLCPVREISIDSETEAHVEPNSPHAIVELFLRPGSSPNVQHGWCELLATICRVAAEFHTYGELRALRSQHGNFQQALLLLRQLDASTDLDRTAMEIVNEGRRFIETDRLSLLLRRGKSWRLVAASGVDRIDRRADTTKGLQTLAKVVAKWGDPLFYDGGGGGENNLADELPRPLSEVLHRHLDQSHARQLHAIPIEYKNTGEQAKSRSTRRVLPQAMLVAEQFELSEVSSARQSVLELAQLCAPALCRSTRLDRFPIRTALRWSRHWSWLRLTAGFFRVALVLAVMAAVVTALVTIPRDFVVEAPATLSPLVERDVFASASGVVAEVRVSHGQQVAAGDVLAVLHDPQLSLDLQRVAGEIETVSKRLEAIAVARTDRRFREDAAGQQLPLSAEAQQLGKRVVNLRMQREILQGRREALTLRSPTAGQVLTLDVQHLLRARPVERGQVLLTVADSSTGWRLDVDVPQDRLGRILAAQQADGVELPVQFRLSGDVHHTYKGHVEAVPPTAVLETDGLVEESPPVRVRVSVDEQSLEAARPGMTARVRIVCGQRSLGYVWLHDIWETVYSWWVFS